MPETYSLYVWGNYLYESEADIRVATDGTRAGAGGFVDELLELIEMDELPGYDGKQMPFGGAIVTEWEDPHGQWDMALVRH